MKKTELLSPAGSFESGYYAIQNGANALYLGLESFSARKSAKNFTLEEIRSLKSLAHEKNVRIFAAVNTVIAENEIDSLTETIYRAKLSGIDAFIIQDPAILEIAEKATFEIEIHASTQMAVHNIHGAAFLADHGIKRAVLSRELPLREIEKIKKAVPDLELEVFIHGALCYSFSGLCLASGMLLDRSGNRGECAQICRSLYKWDKNSGYPFSCNDLNMENHISELIQMGIDSLKIEGRMKSPEYVASATAFYREIIDGKKPSSEIKNKIQMIFSRKYSEGYSTSRSGKEIISSDYPGHRGVYIGKAGKIAEGYFEIIPKETLSLKDGIMFFSEKSREPFRLSIEAFKEKNGKERRFGEKGKPVFIKTAPSPANGTDIYLISSRSNDLKQVSSTSFKPWKNPINISATISDSAIILRTDKFKDFIREISSEPSEKSVADSVKSVFMKSDKSLFIPAEISVKGENLNIFVNPSELKQIKREYYLFLETETEKEIKKKIGLIKETVLHNENHPILNELLLFMNKRENLNPINKTGNEKNRKIPFATYENLSDIKTLAEYNRNVFIPMIPVIYSDENYFEKIERLIKSDKESIFIIGLSNIGQFQFAEKLSELPNVFFFIDFYLYTANHLTAEYYQKISDRIIAGYKWIEKKSDFISGIPFIEVNKSFEPPLFFSSACFKKHNDSGCKECLKSFTYNLSGEKFRFKLIVKECKTYLFRD